MSQITVYADLCKRDGVCVAVCPTRTLALNAEGIPEEVAESKCILCGHCVAVCACDALTHAGLPQETFLPVPKELPDPGLIDGFLNSRRSVREFKPLPIAKETIEAMLGVARRAPTATNSQKLHWIVVNDSAKVRALAAEIVNWARAAGFGSALLEQWGTGNDVILRGAPAVVVACTPEDYAWGKSDCAIALTFFELAAEARGLGVCWAGYLTHVAGLHEPIRQMLSVPNGYAVQGGVMLGERKFTYRWIPPRKPLSVQWI